MKQHKNLLRSRVRAYDRAVKRGDQGQRPKFAEPRKHKQHVHPLRDEYGAFTLVGKNPFGPRRIWLAGISAQRGF